MRSRQIINSNICLAPRPRSTLYNPATGASGSGPVSVVDLSQVELKVYDMPLAKVQLNRKSKTTGMPVVRRCGGGSGREVAA